MKGRPVCNFIIKVRLSVYQRKKESLSSQVWSWNNQAHGACVHGKHSSPNQTLPVFNFFLSATPDLIYYEERALAYTGLCNTQGKGTTSALHCPNSGRAAPDDLIFIFLIQKWVFGVCDYCDRWAAKAHQLKFGCLSFSGHRAIEKGREKMG